MNNSSAHLITMYRSNKNFSNVQHFKVEVNLWSHSFPSDSEGQTDLSAYKNNSDFITLKDASLPPTQHVANVSDQQYCTGPRELQFNQCQGFSLSFSNKNTGSFLFLGSSLYSNLGSYFSRKKKFLKFNPVLMVILFLIFF